MSQQISLVLLHIVVLGLCTISIVISNRLADLQEDTYNLQVEIIKLEDQINFIKTQQKHE